MGADGRTRTTVTITAGTSTRTLTRVRKTAGASRWAVGITLTFFVVEVVGGLLSHSLALLQDAGHMLLDVVAQALALLALYVASRPPDARRTFGWQRVEILAALFNGVTLVVLSGSVMWWSVTRFARAGSRCNSTSCSWSRAIGLVANLVGRLAAPTGSENLNMKSAYLSRAPRQRVFGRGAHRRGGDEAHGPLLLHRSHLVAAARTARVVLVVRAVIRDRGQRGSSKRCPPISISPASRTRSITSTA